MTAITTSNSNQGKNLFAVNKSDDLVQVSYKNQQGLMFTLLRQSRQGQIYGKTSR
jgi:hypothetical protein